MNREALLTYVDRNCPRLLGFLSELQESENDGLIVDILDTPNPRSAAGRLDDLLAGDALPVIAWILARARKRKPFLATVGGSGFLFSIVRRNPALAESLLLCDGYLIRETLHDKEEALRNRGMNVAETVELDRLLRVYKEEEYLRIGCRDLAGLADVPEVMEEISDLAAACVQAALDFHIRRLTAKHGLPDGVGEQAGCVVLGMGKVSGRELNFSSDLDLIFLRSPETGRTAGPAAIPVAQFYENLVRSVARSLSEITEDGFVFRIDLRLRPEGDKGELVPSLNNAVEYYLGWGRTWERAALMKAVPIAGDRGLGEAFLEELEPFIFRKHLDYSTLDDMRAMKVAIATQLKRKPGINIKLGQGGIREIEFFVQALQLINAGRTPRVRSSGTLKALDLLEETGLLEPKTKQDLREAYLFFRKTEHRIQINQQLQTHELPRTVEDQEELARRMGYRDDALQRFLADLEQRRHLVEELFSSMFYHSEEELLQQVSSAARDIVEGIHDEQRAYVLLAEHGFEDPNTSYPLIKHLVHPTVESGGAEKSRNLLERLAPLFVEELIKSPEPDKTLVALVGFIESLHGAHGYLSTFLENPATVRFLVNILGGSRFFTDLLIRHPQAIDSLIAGGIQQPPKGKAALERDLDQRLAYFGGFEDRLDVLRRFKHEETLMIGVRHLSGEIDSPTARRLVANLAEVCLSVAVGMAVREMPLRFGPSEPLDPLPFVILGMGKLGGREMTYLSDLDVIFIYHYPDEKLGRLSAHEWFSRLASRIISILSVPTSEGSVFAIDTRLRPSGNKGPLVSSLESFRDYHRTTSKLWEKQALIRARPLTGPLWLCDEVGEIVRDCIVHTQMSAEDVAEISRLRKRMESELALEDDLHVDLKTGHGGLVDVEFVVQAAILEHAREHPEILRSNTLEAITALRKAGILDEPTAMTLDSGYRFLSNLEDWLRIMEYRSVDRMPLAGDKFRSLALRLGYGEGGEQELLRDYYQVTGSIRSIYASRFGGEGRKDEGR